MNYGALFTALGYVTGAMILVLELKRQRIWNSQMMRTCIFGAVAGIVIARVTEFLVDGWPRTIPFWLIIDPRIGGKSMVGGFLGGWVAFELAKRRQKVFAPTGNAWALGLSAGESVGRIGCFFNECCYGRKTEVPWAVLQHGALRHPAQLYSMFATGAIFAILLKLRVHFPQPNFLLSSYLILWGASRFVIEAFRENSPVAFGLSAMQWASLDLVIVGVVGVIRKLRAYGARNE